MVYVTHVRRVIRNVPIELWQRLRVLAAERNTTISKLMVEASEIYFLGDSADGTPSVVKDEHFVVEVEDYLE